MRRWILTSSLFALALLAWVLAPRFVQKLSDPPVPPTAVTAPDFPDISIPTGLETSVPMKPTVTVETPKGPLKLSQTLDHEVLQADSSNSRYLVLEVLAPSSSIGERQSVHISLVMDTSGSMSSEGKLRHARMAASELLDQLQVGDSFSLVTFADRAEITIPTTDISGVEMAKRTLSGVSPEGGTNLYDGIRAGLSQLEAIQTPGVRRVVVLSDGMANIGQTDPDALAREASSLVNEGISVSGVGLGLDYSEDTLSAISDAGGGTYRFVNRPGQLSEVFASEIQKMSELVAREAMIELNPPPATEIIEVFGYSTHRTQTGHQIFLGDVHAGETRKVVARVNIQADSEDRVAVSNANLKYFTPATESEAASSFTDVSSLTAVLSRDVSVIASSTNLGASRQGVQAHASWYMDEGARAWERGDRKANRAMMAQGKALLAEAAEANKDEVLASQAIELESHARAFDAADFDSDDGLYRVKKAKEDARAYAH